MTSFFAVHLVLTIVSLTLGTIIGVYGIRALVKRRSGSQRAIGEHLQSMAESGR